ncbi:hypothetical protein JTE90_019936 [Oedothorax gibbosus]|uniref:Uncharacterized protein n=1 Tax=Oedothorax gibbosus TaxID=931172 RepID=A0AAV6UQA1_9ARAC|nr:hypothetical protein JTE90_019936 [Oedothorax gibbosus]
MPDLVPLAKHDTINTRGIRDFFLTFTKGPSPYWESHPLLCSKFFIRVGFHLEDSSIHLEDFVSFICDQQSRLNRRDMA